MAAYCDSVGVPLPGEAAAAAVVAAARAAGYAGDWQAPDAEPAGTQAAAVAMASMESKPLPWAPASASYQPSGAEAISFSNL